MSLGGLWEANGVGVGVGVGVTGGSGGHAHVHGVHPSPSSMYSPAAHEVVGSAVGWGVGHPWGNFVCLCGDVLV